MASVDITDNSGEIRDELNAAIERALIQCGMVAEGYAKLLCPTDTGRLKGSIVYVTSTSHSEGESPAEPEDYTPKGTPPKGEVIIGTNVEYAPYVELGTRKQKAQPFLRPAAEDHASEYGEIIESELKGQN